MKIPYLLIIGLLFLTHAQVLAVRANPTPPLCLSTGFNSTTDDAASIYTNPAGLAVRTGWHTYYHQSYDLDRQSETMMALEGGPFGVGFHYSEYNQRILRNFSLGAGIKIGRQFFTGISGHWWSGSPADEVNSNSHGARFERSLRGFSVDAGLMVRPYDWFSFSFITRHLGDRDLPAHVYQTYELGTAFRPYGARWTWMFDAVIRVRDFEDQDYDEFQYRAGVEIESLDGVFLNAGMDNEENQIFGARFNFYRAAVQYDIYLKNEKVKRHGLGLVFSKHNFRTSLPDRRQLIRLIVGGKLQDEPPLFSLIGSSGSGVIDLLEQMERVRQDPEVVGLLLQIMPIETGAISGIGGLLQELRQAIVQIRKAGKVVVAYVESGGGLSEYYLASAANQVIIPPSATVGGLGALLTINRTRGLYEKLGIDWDYLTVGEYKSTFHHLADAVTDTQKKLIDGLIDDLYAQLLADISASRQLSAEQVENLAQGQFFTASQARNNGLVDELGYDEQARIVLGQQCDLESSDFARIETIDIRRKVPYRTSWKTPPRVAVIGLYGTIETGRSSHNLIWGARTTGAQTITHLLDRVKNDPEIAAVVLRIDSGGGSAVGADLIWYAVDGVKRTGKPVVVSMGDVAGSGGYLVGCHADSILAMPATLTGSIGVVAARPVLKRLFDKIGVTEEIYAKGDYRRLGARTEAMDDNERMMYTNLLESTYDMFVDKVAAGRGLSPRKVREIAEGRVYTGQQAIRVGLIDRIGSLTEAISAAASLAGINDGYETLIVRQNNLFLPSRMLSNLSTRLGLGGLMPTNEIRLE